MLRVLHFVLVVFQRFPKRSGYSMQHERDMERAGFRPVAFHRVVTVHMV